MAHERAGLVALESDLIDVDAVLAAYYDPVSYTHLTLPTKLEV